VHKKQISAAIPLVILEGKEVTKAPKIYENQIFRDVYDKEGNHDRMLDTSNLKDLEPRVIFQ
jgi:hypothetical protein